MEGYRNYLLKFRNTSHLMLLDFIACCSAKNRKKGNKNPAKADAVKEVYTRRSGPPVFVAKTARAGLEGRCDGFIVQL